MTQTGRGTDMSAEAGSAGLPPRGPVPPAHRIPCPGRARCSKLVRPLADSHPARALPGILQCRDLILPIRYEIHPTGLTFMANRVANGAARSGAFAVGRLTSSSLRIGIARTASGFMPHSSVRFTGARGWALPILSARRFLGITPQDSSQVRMVGPCTPPENLSTPAGSS
jgi:hypothetical protein